MGGKARTFAAFSGVARIVESPTGSFTAQISWPFSPAFARSTVFAEKGCARGIASLGRSYPVVRYPLLGGSLNLFLGGHDEDAGEFSPDFLTLLPRSATCIG